MLDYPHSFVTFFTNPSQGGNIARIQVDAVCDVEGWGSDGGPERFYLIVPCRSERMYEDGQLFQMPNYEFCGIFTEDRVSLIRTHWTSDRENNDIQAIADRFEQVAIDGTEMKAELLPDVESIVSATLANRLLVARTMVRDEATGTTAMLEYPIKTMNVTRDPYRFQVDTGPIIVPLFDSTAEPLGRFAIAHTVYWQDDRVEFVLRKPHVVGSNGDAPVEVTDYTELSFSAATHEIWAEVR
ncbi:MAG: hypothetical protein ACRDHN_14605 [Thermomicrobiales bacterium]